MSYFTDLKCKECATPYPTDRSFMCLSCLGPLEVAYDYERIRSEVDREEISARPLNLWRYRELLPVTDTPIAGHYSGWTPLIRARRLGRHLGVEQLYLKDDSTNRPTLSYKDRVVPVALSRGVELGYETFACASTGNLGNAVAAHCAAAGLKSLIFIPGDIEPAKITASLLCGPRVIALNGNYDEVNRLCAQIGDEYGWGFVNVNLRPYYTEGAKTLGFEIAEQMNWKLPDHVVLPTAGGTLLPKVGKALEELRCLGWAQGETALHVAQASGCAPVVRAMESGQEEIDPVKPDTIAKSIAIGDPADGPYVLSTVRASGGQGMAVEDEEILEAIQLLAEYEGILTEPAGGTTLAAAIKIINNGGIKSSETLVVALTGNAYKSIEVFDGRTSVTATLRPNLGVFKQWYENGAGAGDVTPPAAV